MKKLKQLVISIENSPGRLYEVTRRLGEAGINLRALNLVDTGAFGQLRLLVSDMAKARRILMEMHLPAFVDHVVAARIPDKPGSLSRVLRLLNDSGINIAYMYSFTGFSMNEVVMVFRFSDNDGAVKILEEKGITLLDKEAFGILENSCSNGEV